MKNLIKKSFLRLFDPVAFRLGYRKKETLINKGVVGNDKNDLLFTFFNVIKSVPFFPGHIIDIGANHGTWTREALKVFPEARFTLLEPQEKMKASINDLLASNPKITFHAVGAGKKKGSFKFTIVDRDDSCNFIMSEKEAAQLGYQQLELPVVTLNHFIMDQNLPFPDLVKIDAEGLDLDVLEGADSCFGKTEVFMVEAGVVNKQFANSVQQIINYLDLKGYRLFDITDINRPFTNRALWLMELAFVKKGGVIDSHNWLKQ